MRVSATAKYIGRLDPQDPLVTRAIVGRTVEDAAAILRFMPQGAAKDVAKVLKSATANAENNHDLSRRRPGDRRRPSPTRVPPSSASDRAPRGVRSPSTSR